MARADDSIYVSLFISIPTLFLLLGVFDLLRMRLWWVYTPRVRHPKYSGNTPERPKGGYLRWLAAVLENYSAETILKVSGLDGLVMIIFLQFMTDQMLLTAFVGTVVLLPSWYSANGLESNEDTRNQYSFALTTLANLPHCDYKENGEGVVRLFPPCEESGLHWRYTLAVLAAWLFTLRALSRLSITCCDYVKYRERYLSGDLFNSQYGGEQFYLQNEQQNLQENVQNIKHQHKIWPQQRLSVIVERVPPHLRSMRALKKEFEQLCGEGSVHSARLVVDDLGALKYHHARRQSAIEKLFDKRARRARQRFLQLNIDIDRRKTWEDSTSGIFFDSRIFTGTKKLFLPTKTSSDNTQQVNLTTPTLPSPKKSTTLMNYLNTTRSWHTESPTTSARRQSIDTSRTSLQGTKRQAEMFAILERAVNAAERVVETARRSAIVLQDDGDNEEEPRILRRDHNNHKRKVLAVPYFETLVDELEDRILLEHTYRLVLAFHSDDRRSHVSLEDLAKFVPNRRERYRGCFWLMSRRQPIDQDEEFDVEAAGEHLLNTQQTNMASLKKRFFLWYDQKGRSIDKELARLANEPALAQIMVTRPFFSVCLPTILDRSRLRLEALIFIDFPDSIYTVFEATEAFVKTIAGRRCCSCLKKKEIKMKANQTDSGFVGSSTAFITFTSPIAKLAAIQSLLVSDAYGLFAQSAPEARDIIWSNVHKDYDGIIRRSKLISIVLRAALLFWASVVGFCANSVQLLYFLGLRKFSNAFQAIIVSIAPVLLLLAIINLLPLCFQALARFYERQKSYSAVDFSVVDRFLLYQAINVYASIFSAAILNSVRKGWQNPYFFIKKLGQTVYSPAAMVYFAKFISFSCAASPLWVIRAWPLISRGPRVWTIIPPDLPGLLYGWAYPKLLMSFTVVSTFWIAAPLISVLAFVYFNLIQLYYRYLLLWVHMPVYESGGKYFKRCVNMICLGLAVSNILIFFWFLTNSLPGYAICVLPLPFMVFSFKHMAQEAYFMSTERVSLTEARRTENIGVDCRGFDPSLYLQPERKRPGTVKSSSLPGRSLKVRLAHVLKTAGCAHSASETTLSDMNDLDSLPDEEVARRIARYSARSKNHLHPDTFARLRSLAQNTTQLRHICNGLEQVYSGNADFFETEDNEQFERSFQEFPNAQNAHEDTTLNNISPLHTPLHSAVSSPIHSPTQPLMPPRPPVATNGEVELFPRLRTTLADIGFDDGVPEESAPPGDSNFAISTDDAVSTSPDNDDKN